MRGITNSTGYTGALCVLGANSGLQRQKISCLIIFNDDVSTGIMEGGKHESKIIQGIYCL